MNGRVQIFFYTGIYIALCMLAITIPLLPMGFSPDRLAMPELFFALTIAWVIRSPRSAPVIIIAGFALLADAVLMHSIGLWALLIVISSELARLNSRVLQEGGIIAETVFFAGILATALVFQNLIFFIVFLDTYPISRLIQIVLLSVLYYTFFAVFLHYVVRLRGVITKDRPDRLGKVG